MREKKLIKAFKNFCSPYFLKKVGIENSQQIFYVIIIWLCFAVFEGVGISMLYPILEYIQYSELKNSNIISNSVTNILNYFNIKLNFFIILIFALIPFALRFIFSYIKSVMTAKAEHKLESVLREKLINSFFKAKLSFFVNKHDGNISSSILYDVARARSIIASIYELLGNVFLLLIYVLISSIISFNLLLYSIPFAIIILILISFLRKRFLLRGRIISDLSGDFSNITFEGMKNITTLKMRNIVSSYLDEIMLKSRKLSLEQFLEQKDKFLVQNISGPLLLLGIFFTIYIGTSLLKLDLITLGIFLLVMNRMLPTLQMINLSIIQIITSYQSLTKIFNISKEASDHEEKHTGNLKFLKFKKKIVFENVSFKYAEKSKLILDRINFSINKGDSFAIVGDSGSGKTSLVNLLTHLLPPTSGNIFVDNNSLNDISIGEYRKKIAYLPQKPELINNTIKKNLLLGNDKKPSDQEIERVLIDCYCQFVFDLPKKLQTHVGDEGKMISGGQRQRLVLARVLLNKPEILVLDESISGLDENSIEKIKRTLEKLKGKLTQVIISHRYSFINNVDRMIFLENGKIIINDTKNNVIKHKKFLKLFNV